VYNLGHYGSVIVEVVQAQRTLETIIKERRFSKTFLRFQFYFEIFQIVSLVV
jgi:hypothetical protein